MRVYVKPLNERRETESRYSMLLPYGKIFLFYRTFFGMPVDCDVPLAFNTSTARVVVLLRGRAQSEDIGLASDFSMPNNLSLPTLQKIVEARFREHGLTKEKLRDTDVSKVDVAYRNALALSLVQILDRYLPTPLDTLT